MPCPRQSAPGLRCLGLRCLGLRSRGVRCLLLLAACTAPLAGRAQTRPASAPTATATSMSQLPETDDTAPARPATLPALTTEEGVLAGSSFRIDLPSSGASIPWNHDLIVYYHGYQSGPQHFDRDPATRAVHAPSRLIAQLLARGYAVVEPGYKVGGWAIATAPGDAELLRQYFRAHYGQPRQTLVVGQSMGGLLTVLTLERAPQTYAGGLALCGVLAPADQIMQRAFANRVAFDAFFPGILPDVEHIPPGFHMNDPAEAAVIQKALDAHPSEAALLRSLADIHTNRGLADVLIFNTFVIQDLREKAGGNPFDNRNLIYTGTTDDSTLNAKVRRYAADPRALAYVAENGSPSGALKRPLLALHTIYDPLVPPSVAAYYDELTLRMGAGGNFVQQYVDRDGHCNITPEQAGLAFDELTAWVDTGVRPAPGRLPDALGQKPVRAVPAAQPAKPKIIGKPQ